MALAETGTVLDRAIRVHLSKLGRELIAAAEGTEPPWATMARVARSLARLGMSGPPDPLDHDADENETTRYYRILRELASA